MTHSADWSPLCGSDPTPGNPDAVRRLGDRYVNTAADVARQATNLQRLGSYTGWDSEAGEAFSEHARELAGKLLDAKNRYEATGSQLRRWAGSVGTDGCLEDVQQRSEALRREAKAAEATRAATATVPSVPAAPDAPPPTAGEIAAQAQRTAAFGAAGEPMNRCQRELDDVVSDRDRVAGQVAGAIRNVVDDDLKDSWWERREEDVAGVAKWIDFAADMLGYLALLAALASMFIPGVNLLVAAALLTMVALSAHSVLALTGNGFWGDVALHAFALATLGAGKVLTTGGKLLGVTVRGTRPAMAALRTAAAPRAAAAAFRSTRASTQLARTALAPLLNDPATSAACSHRAHRPQGPGRRRQPPRPGLPRSPAASRASARCGTSRPPMLSLGR